MPKDKTFNIQTVISKISLLVYAPFFVIVKPIFNNTKIYLKILKIYEYYYF